jgi:hypothetical protein
MDYRDIPKEFEKKFDAFVSIEMVEVNFLETLAKTVYLISPPP